MRLNHRKVKSQKANSQKYGVEPRQLMTSFENKHVDTAINVSVTNGGNILSIAPPAQGLLSTNRVADRCRFLSLDWRMFFELGTNAVGENMRFIVFQSVGLLPVSTPPALTDILESVSPSSPIKYNADKLFRIIHDEQFSMSEQGDTALVVKHHKLKLSIPDINFVAGSIVQYSGQVYCLFLGIQPTIFTNVASVCRLWFADTD
jgi:hypothetical protein